MPGDRQALAVIIVLYRGGKLKFKENKKPGSGWINHCWDPGIPRHKLQPAAETHMTLCGAFQVSGSKAGSDTFLMGSVHHEAGFGNSWKHVQLAVFRPGYKSPVNGKGGFEEEKKKSWGLKEAEERAPLSPLPGGGSWSL